jgi:hypothetical protein
MCLYPKEGGGPRSKKATLKHYNRQNKRGGWLFGTVGWDTLTSAGPKAWFRWTFLELDQHAPDCRWAKLFRR